MGGLERRDATGRQDATGVDSTCALSICRYYSRLFASWAWRWHLNESYNTSIFSLPSALPLLSTSASASSSLRRISTRPTPKVSRRFLRSTTHTQVLHAKLPEGVRAIRREHLGRPGELVGNLSGGGRVDRTSAVLQEKDDVSHRTPGQANRRRCWTDLGHYTKEIEGGQEVS